jgi:hypothetical protein
MWTLGACADPYKTARVVYNLLAERIKMCISYWTPHDNDMDNLNHVGLRGEIIAERRV